MTHSLFGFFFHITSQVPKTDVATPQLILDIVKAPVKKKIEKRENDFSIFSLVLYVRQLLKG